MPRFPAGHPNKVPALDSQVYCILLTMNHLPHLNKMPALDSQVYCILPTMNHLPHLNKESALDSHLVSPGLPYLPHFTTGHLNKELSLDSHIYHILTPVTGLLYLPHFNTCHLKKKKESALDSPINHLSLEQGASPGLPHLPHFTTTACHTKQ